MLYWEVDSTFETLKNPVRDRSDYRHHNRTEIKSRAATNVASKYGAESD
jgi:hypothetical protein